MPLIVSQVQAAVGRKWDGSARGVARCAKTVELGRGSSLREPQNPGTFSLCRAWSFPWNVLDLLLSFVFLFGAGCVSSDERRSLSRREPFELGTNTTVPNPQGAQEGQSSAPGESPMGTLPEPATPAEPNITKPGTDSTDFPDSPYAVPAGVTYVEGSLTYESSKGPRVRDYTTAILVRTGLGGGMELRLSSPGLIHETSPSSSTTGFGPLTMGLKLEMSPEGSHVLCPAVGSIVQVLLPTASAGFDSGVAEPTFFLNFAHPLPEGWELEWNAGIGAVKDDTEGWFAQGLLLWAIGRELSPELEVFLHGFAVFPSRPGDDPEFVFGPGVACVVTDRFLLDFSYNFGLTEPSPHRIVRLGGSVAF
jgi:hypothetical protein